MRKAVLYIHGKNGSAAEAEFYEPLFPAADVVGIDYKSQTPWEAREEFPDFFDRYGNNYGAITVIANSIGAYLTMCSLGGKKIERALFVSPIVDMEKLIADMMRWANVTEDELCAKAEILTSFGETLSWEYLCYVREHSLTWTVPTHILCGENDNLTSASTIKRFVDSIDATLTVMEGVEHWFHTAEQMDFLAKWVKEVQDKEKT